MSLVEGYAREQISFLPPCIEDYVAPNALVRVVDAFVASVNLADLGFGRAVAGVRRASQCGPPRRGPASFSTAWAVVRRV
jgi:hypothetical protein